jgi:alkylation response protein AidB-like acyl-CoA dehydrogenase
MSVKTETPQQEKKGAPGAPQTNGTSFAETAMRLGGKSEAESRSMGALDAADDQVETLFAPQYQTVNSPSHRIVWEKVAPLELFVAPPAPEPTAKCRQVMDKSVEVVRKHRAAGTLRDASGKVSDQVMKELGEAGYWGMRVEEKYGGVGAPTQIFGPFLTRMATVDATISGLASVHGCIGAVDPVSSFGNEEQKSRFLPKLASGERLSAFALTEPNAGSDLTSIRTRAERDGDDYVVTGEKLFITNAQCGRTIGLVCLIEGKPAVLIVDLPDQENEQFQIRRYGLWALKHAYNVGLVFNKLRVPASNRLHVNRGDGLTIAYHGLNYGRVALCAGAAGNMRMMLADMLPWAKFRRTYGQPIIKRELVQRRCGSMAGYIVACDALTDWCGWLLDAGYRGEMECTIAKIFGSERQKNAAIELYMKTHGGRSFLHGHPFGDNVHEFLAPCIYEGEGEMLCMAFFKSLVKEHGKKYFEPVGRVLAELGVRQPNFANPKHLMAFAGPGSAIMKWEMSQRFAAKSHTGLPELPGRLREYVTYAVHGLQKGGMEIHKAMMKYQLKLADRQLKMSEISQRLQDYVTMIVTALYAGKKKDELMVDAAEIACEELRLKLTGDRPSDRYYRDVTRLGEKIADGGFKDVAGVETAEILFKYDEK